VRLRQEFRTARLTRTFQRNIDGRQSRVKVSALGPVIGSADPDAGQQCLRAITRANGVGDASRPVEQAQSTYRPTSILLCYGAAM
jgi:hypothetical protein